MKITQISAYQVDLPLVEGRYSWSEGKYVEVFDSTVVELVTDDGRSGFGEVCPLGPFYLPAFAAGARAGIGELSGSLIGRDPTALGPINRLMDRALLGHPYVKSAIDMACWDILGKASGLPLVTLLAGRQGEAIDLYRAIWKATGPGQIVLIFLSLGAAALAALPIDYQKRFINRMGEGATFWSW